MPRVATSAVLETEIPSVRLDYSRIPPISEVAKEGQWAVPLRLPVVPHDIDGGGGVPGYRHAVVSYSREGIRHGPDSPRSRRGSNSFPAVFQSYSVVLSPPPGMRWPWNSPAACSVYSVQTKRKTTRAG